MICNYIRKFAIVQIENDSNIIKCKLGASFSSFPLCKMSDEARCLMNKSRDGAFEGW